MIYKMYSVKDELSNVFLAPALMRDHNEAKRQFKSQINNIPVWKDNPSDFSLYYMGTFDEETGTIESTQEKIAGGRSVVE